MKKFFVSILSVFMMLLFVECNNMSVVHANDLREKTIGIAANEVGYMEKASMDDLYNHTSNAGANNYTKYAADVGVPNGQPWGSVFVWWVMYQAGVPSEVYPQLVTATTDFFREKDLWRDREEYTPQPGDYAVLGNVANCGIVEAVTEDSVTIIVGNKGETNSVTRFTTTLDDTIIKGYGIIDYNYVSEPVGVDLGDVYCATLLKTDVSKTIRNYENRPVLWNEVELADYRWLFEKQTDGTYIIQSLYDGKVLEVKDGGVANDVDVIMAEKREENNENQKWYICEYGVGYRIIPQNAINYCLNVVDNNNADGTVMTINIHNNSYAQMFTLNEIDYVKLTGITISSYATTINVGKQQVLKYSFTPENTTCNTVLWECSDSSIAEVSGDGTVTAKKEGTVTITCRSTFDNTIAGEITIQIKKEEVEQEDRTVTVGNRIEGKQCWFVITNVNKKTVKVTGISNKKVTSLKIPATVKYEGNTYKVTSIDKNAFKNNKKLKTVTIGKNVESIQANAFLGCKKLEKVVIGKNVTTIGKKSFYECKKLKTIKIKSKKLKKIGSNAFKKIDTNPVIYTPKGKMKDYKNLFKGKI